MKTAWRATTLGEIADIVSGGTPKTSVGDYWDGGIPWATPRDLSLLEGHTISATPRTISEAGLRSCGASVLPAHSVLLSSRAPIGHVALNTVPMATNQGFKSLVPDPEIADSKFLYWWLRWKRPVLESLGNGATFKEISKKVTQGIEIELPPIGEQRRIAEVLDAADALRFKRRQALAQLDTLTQAIFIEMFGRDEWPASPLDSAFSEKPILGTMTPPGPHGRWISLRVGNIQNHRLDLNDRKYVDLPANQVERHSVRDGDLLMARAIASIDHLGKCIVAMPRGERWAFDSHLMRLRLDPDVLSPTYLKEWLGTAAGRRAFLAVTRRSSVQFNVNTKEIASLRVPMPPVRDQQAFAERVCRVESERNTMANASVHLDALFASLQQRAFRGEL